MWEDEAPKDLKSLNIYSPPPSEEAQHIASIVVWEGDNYGMPTLNFQTGKETLSFYCDSPQDAKSYGDKIRKTIITDLDQFAFDSVQADRERAYNAIQGLWSILSMSNNPNAQSACKALETAMGMVMNDESAMSKAQPSFGSKSNDFPDLREIGTQNA